MGRSKRHLTGTAIYARARLGSKDRESVYSDIWYHYYPRIRVFVQHLLSQPEDIEDAAQEAMLRAFRHLQRYRPERAFSTWIYTIARNYCLDQLRKKSARREVAVGDSITGFESPYPTPETALLRSETAGAVRALIESLSPDDRQIAFLRFYETMSFRQISEVLNIPVGTLKYRIHKMRGALRERRTEYGE